MPLTFMNNSGAIFNYSSLSKHTKNEIIVICDTLDLPQGTIRIKKGGSSAGHNGLKSLMAHLLDREFIRIYVGIGRPIPPETVVEYVLRAPQEEGEQEMIKKGIDEATIAVIDLINGKSLMEVIRANNRKVTP